MRNDIIQLLLLAGASVRFTAADPAITARQAGLLHDGPGPAPTTPPTGAPCATFQDRGSGGTLTICGPGPSASAEADAGDIIVPVVIGAGLAAGALLPGPNGGPPEGPDPDLPGDNMPTSTVPASSVSTVKPTGLVQITSKWGTDKATFDNYIKALDGAVGTAVSDDGASFQMYETLLVQAQVDDVEKQSWLASIKLIPDYEQAFVCESCDASTPPQDDYSRAVSKVSDPTKTETRASLRKRTIDTRASSAPQLQLLSADINNPEIYQQDYTFDDSLGKGSTIFIIDEGFDLTAQDLQPDGRKVDSYVVPRELAIPNVMNRFNHPIPGQDPLQSPYPSVMEDNPGQYLYKDSAGNQQKGQVEGHGTAVASVAAGLTYGVASKANLYLIKIASRYQQKANPDIGVTLDYDTSGPVTELALGAALSKIQSVVAQNPGLKGNSVINLSLNIGADKRKVSKKLGTTIPVHYGSTAYDMFYNFIQWCSDNGIVIVACAGNDGPGSLGDKNNLGDTLPQRLGMKDGSSVQNQMITVGGVTNDGSINVGKLWPKSTPAGPTLHKIDGETQDQTNNNQGFVDVYAQAKSVIAESELKAKDFLDGTSVAAPQVAGLAAYLIQHTTTGKPYGDVAKEVKQAIVGLAFAWQVGSPDIKAANNGAREQNPYLCSNNPPPPQKRGDTPLGKDSCHSTSSAPPAPSSAAPPPPAPSLKTCFSSQPDSSRQFPRAVAKQAIDSFCTVFKGVVVNNQAGNAQTWALQSGGTTYNMNIRADRVNKDNNPNSPVIDQNDCQTALLSTTDSCDTNTIANKQGGQWVLNGIVWTVQRVSTANYNSDNPAPTYTAAS